MTPNDGFWDQFCDRFQWADLVHAKKRDPYKPPGCAQLACHPMDLVYHGKLVDDETPVTCMECIAATTRG